jgi:glycosyltransferase involved in cell wall biosynthesis
MRRLVIAGLALKASGMTGVLERMASLAGRDWNVTVLGFAPGASWRQEIRQEAGLRLCLLHGPYRHYYLPAAVLQAEIFDSAPDAILIHGPMLLAGPLLRQLQPCRANSTIIHYLPVEGEPVAEMSRFLPLADLCLVYTEQCRVALQAKGAAFGSGGIPPIGVLGHGVDRAMFHPLDHATHEARRAAARRQFFPPSKNFDGAFLVLNANRPYERKRLDLSIAGFASFARRRSDAFLILHTGHRSPAQQIRLCQAIEEAGMTGRICLSPEDPGGEPLDQAALNMLYNACDVGLTTAMGEGWGLGSFEHASTRAAQIVPDHTSFRENWRGAAILLPAEERQHVAFEGADMFATTPEAVSSALAALYGDAAFRDAMAQAAFDRATASERSWEQFAATLSCHLHGVMGHA